jgi:hypothetical protein
MLKITGPRKSIQCGRLLFFFFYTKKKTEITFLNLLFGQLRLIINSAENRRHFDCAPTFGLIFVHLQAGWPDWTNFRLLGVVFNGQCFYITKIVEKFGLLFPTAHTSYVLFLINMYGLGYLLDHFFDEPFWSPCLQEKVSNREQEKMIGRISIACSSTYVPTYLHTYIQPSVNQGCQIFLGTWYQNR